MPGFIPTSNYHTNCLQKTITKKQVQRKMRHAKKPFNILPQNTIGFLYEWLSKNELNANSGVHTVGALPGWKCTGPSNVDDLEDSLCDIHFVLTTKALLNQLVAQAQGPMDSFLTSDGTFNLLDTGYPCLNIGTVDSNHEFKRAGLCVSRHQKTESFKLLFDNVKHSIFMFFGFSLEVLYACPDSAPEIQNALVDCFSPQSKCDGSVNPQPTLETRFMNFVAACYYHVKSAVETNKHRFSSEQSRTLFEGDIEKLHSLSTDTVFDNACVLFFQKWRRRDRPAVEWFQTYWGSARFNAGATGDGLPVASSVIERDNRGIKDYITCHKRLAMGNFLGAAVEELQFISEETVDWPFEYKVVNGKQRRGKAQLWAKSGVKKYLRESDKKKGTWYAPSTSFMSTHPSPSAKLIKDSIYAFAQADNVYTGETFDSYIERATSFYVLSPVQSPLNEDFFFACTCPEYKKNATCKHSLGMSIVKSFVTVPPHWSVPLWKC